MGLGREVADAYISVHGDLSDFRNDLNKAKPITEAMARENADAFTEAWGQRIEKDVNGKWGSIVDALYSNKKIDWDRLVGKFDANGDMDKAQEKIRDFMADMEKSGAITTEEYVKQDDAIKGMLKTLRERNDLDKENAKNLDQQTRGLQMASIANRKLFAEAAAENERWARTFEGMTKNNGLAQMEKDFKSIAEATRTTDWSSFVKGFDGLDDAAGRVREINSLMLDQKRITHENGIAAAASIDEYIAGEKRLMEEKRRALEQAKALRESQDRYKRSLDGMVREHHFARMEQDFKLLAGAMASNDWRQIQRMSRDVDDFRSRVNRVGNEMRFMGRMSDNAFGILQRQLTRATRGSGQLSLGLRQAEAAAGAFVRRLGLGTIAIRLMGRGVDNVVRKIKGLSGFNVVGDVFREGGRFIQNLDRNAVKIAKMTALIAALGSVAVSSLGGAVTIMADLGSTLGGLAALAPAYLIGAGIAGGVLFSALKDMKTVLADLKPAFAALQNTISKKFWDEAAKPIRAMVKDLMPTLKTQLGNTGTAFGKMFGKLATAIKAVPKKDIELMFERMNKGIEIAGDAMAPLTRAFNNLGKAGSKTFERFGTWIVKLSDGFDNFIQKASDDGRLDKWIDNGIEGMKDLGRVVDGTLGIFNALDKAARAAGSKGLNGFANALQGIAAVMQGDRFQSSLTTFFEAFYVGLAGVKQGFLNLAPGIESFLPVLKEIMGSLAEVFAKIGTIASAFLSNKALQDGMKAFADGISQALDKLMPAIQPMANSLGQLFSLMAEVLPNITDLIAKIAITLGPTFDKLLEGIKPLIGPLTDFAKMLIDAIAPVFEKFVNEVLPPLVQLFKDLLPAAEGFVKLFTPVANSLMEGAATTFKSMSDALKEFNIHAGPAGQRMGEIIKKMETTPKVDTGQGHWINTLFQFSTAAVSISPTLAFIGKQFDKLTSGVRENWSRFVTGITGIIKPENIIKNLGSWYIDFSTANQELSNSVTDFFEGIPDVIKERWEGMWRGLTDWWRDVKKNFQKMMSDLLGFETGSEGSHGNVTVGGAGGKGMSPSGKLDPKMFGLPDEEGTKSFFEQLGTWLYDGMSAAFTRLTEVLGLSEFATQWNEFWAAFPVKVQEVWDAIVLWVQTKAAEIKLAIDTFIADAQLNWTLFWDAFPVKVQETWDAILLWITTKVGEIKLAIDTWLAQAKLDWDTFWNGANTKVQEVWTAVKTWIDTKINEIKTGINTFITDVKTGWDNLWNGARTKVEEIWNGIVNFIPQKTAEIKRNIENLARDVKTGWDNLWRDVGNKVRTGWDDVVRGFQTGVDRAVEFVRSLPGKAVAALGNLGGRLKSHGEQMIEGFRQGLVNKFEEVKRFVGTIAQWIADHKGPISYDRRLLIPAGVAIMQSLSTGLRSQLGALKGTLDTVTEVMAAAFTHSKMYVAGADAALGIAAGIKSEKSTLLDAFGQLLPAEASVRIGTGAGGVGYPTPGNTTIINVAEGAIPVSTPTKDPTLVASKVIDGFTSFSNL